MLFEPDVEKMITRPETARDEFLDEFAEYEFFWKKIEQKQPRVNFYTAFKEFKNELPVLLEIKSKYESSEMYRYKRLQRLLRSKKELDVERARNVEIEKILDALGIEHCRNRCKTPFTEGKNKTTMSFKQNLFYCFKTQKKGDSIKFVMELLGKNFVEAVNYLLIV